MTKKQTFCGAILQKSLNMEDLLTRIIESQKQQQQQLKE